MLPVARSDPATAAGGPRGALGQIHIAASRDDSISDMVVTDVPADRGECGEELATVPVEAAEGALAGVDPHVGLEVDGLAEVALAGRERALVRPRVGVDQLVGLEVAHGAEELAATLGVTLEWLLPATNKFVHNEKQGGLE